MKIFEIPIDNFSREEIINHARDFLDEPKFHRIATVNPEFLLEAEKNKEFKKTLLDADLRVVDGFGIVLTGWLRGKHITRFSGADLMEEILKIANEKKLSVFLAVNKDGLSLYEEIKVALQKKYPDLKINGYNINTAFPYSKFIIHDSIVLCNFGAPEQELFLAKLKEQNTELRLAMGVGGSLDYLTGKQKRAPKWLRVIGLEWLWRLILQPKRFKRIWNATIVFLVKSLKKSHTYKIRS